VKRLVDVRKGIRRININSKSVIRDKEGLKKIVELANGLGM
jgi:hypothetical protein